MRSSSLEHGAEELCRFYLRRLGLEVEPPTVEALFRLHRAHAERVPYETTWIHLGERWGIGIESSVRRIAIDGRGGYCFHLNGSLSWLLSTLGYDVTLHVGGVHGPEPSANDLTNHLVLTVGNLPTDENPDGEWYVDVGLGDALHEPLPLRDGTYVQDPMTFRLEHTAGGIGDWHFVHDPRGSFPGMNFRAAPTTIDAFQSRHEHLSTSPESGFVRNPIAQRRLDDRVTMLRGLTLSTRDASGTQSRLIDDRQDWFSVLADELLLQLNGVGSTARDRLWARARAAHEAWERSNE